jgi:hypothetical protein
LLKLLHISQSRETKENSMCSFSSVSTSYMFSPYSFFPCGKSVTSSCQSLRTDDHAVLVLENSLAQTCNLSFLVLLVILQRINKLDMHRFSVVNLAFKYLAPSLLSILESPSIMISLGGKTFNPQRTKSLIELRGGRADYCPMELD